MLRELVGLIKVCRSIRCEEGLPRAQNPAGTSHGDSCMRGYLGKERKEIRESIVYY